MDYLTKAHTASTVAGNGETINVSDYQVCIFNVSGTSTTFSITVYASTDAETFFPIAFVPCDDVNFDYVNTITATGKGYNIDVAPYKKLQVRLDSISNGNITVPVYLTKREN